MVSTCNRNVNYVTRVKRTGNVIFAFNKFDMEGFNQAMHRGMIETVSLRIW